MGGMELGFPKPSVPNLKEQLARKTLRNVRKGHPYVDLREDGKRFVFFCTLCLAPCYSDTVLFAHLNGNLHKERYSAAKATLIGDNPWPFDDGVLFFHSNFIDEEKDALPTQGSGKINLLDDHEHVADLAIVVHGDVSRADVDEDGMDGCLGDDAHSDGEDVPCGQNSDVFVIPGVVGKEEVADLRVRLIGCGRISARFLEKDGARSGMRRFWCEWMGKRDGANNECYSNSLPLHDFAILTFSYYLDLGKQGLFDDIKTLLLTGGEDSNNGYGSTKKRKKSFSDSEVASETLSYQCDSSGEDSQVSTTSISSDLLLHRYDDQLLHSRDISSKTLRRQLRKQQRIASEKMCDICQHKMLPGKDVATLLNLKTGRLACSSRNVYGAFHVFHTSCLVHWVLLCEFEMFTKPPVQPKVRQRSKRRTKSMVNPLGKDCTADSTVEHKQMRKGSEEGTFCDQVHSVFCPDCQGTGLQIEGGALEKPDVPLSEMFKYKISLSNAHRAWMKSPEELENCSTGFAFAVQVDDAKVAELKLLQFYRADEEIL
ncbi:uncharacterized protein LOC104903026 isoform X2 [Beta vulgaris subsp. vulgaris]|uniref:uncharacterized protein LOC104903026 isoform X2 n=1 Tax=Beta vulgaris subsp. vulgaris TaxID=3555 RepID=UPI0020373959|nr:uncharacterized protein LOC104903026 isoform X2 [Beta vulgaris subsp. vulgaris]